MSLSGRCVVEERAGKPGCFFGVFANACRLQDFMNDVLSFINRTSLIALLAILLVALSAIAATAQSAPLQTLSPSP